MGVDAPWLNKVEAKLYQSLDDGQQNGAEVAANSGIDNKCIVLDEGLS